MKKNNGFTLVELLAVIVILGIIMVIGGTAAIKIKRDANIKEAQQIKAMLIDLAPGIYSYEYTSGIKDNKSYCEKEESSGYTSGASCDNGTFINFSNYFYPKYKGLANNTSLFVTFDKLYEKKYLEKVKNPADAGSECTGYLIVKKTSNGPKFDACLNCPGLSGDGLDTSCSSSVISVELTK